MRRRYKGSFMRHLIISDIHGDWFGLETIEAQAHELGGYDDIWFLGDVFGYCTFVEALDCLEWLTDRSAVCIKGNWEWWITTPDQDRLDSTRKLRLDAIRQYREIIPDDAMELIIGWPEQMVFPQSGATIYHGCPYIDRVTGHIHSSTTYLTNAQFNNHVFNNGLVSTDFLFVGHSHEIGMITFSPERQSEVHLFGNNLPQNIRNGLRNNCHRTILVGTGGRELRQDNPACFVIYDDESRSVLFTEREV